MRKSLVLWIGLIGISCHENEIKPCLVNEAKVIYPGNDEYLKYIYTYDTEHNLVEAQELRFDELQNNYVLSSTNQYVISDNLVFSQLTRTPNQNEGSFTLKTYDYVKKGDTTFYYLLSQVFENGINTFERQFEGRFFENPKDGIYLNKDILGTYALEEYSNGNLTRVALPSPTGTINAYDTTWSYVTEYIYDTRPNVARNIAIGNLLSWVPNNGFCRNNVIEIRHFIQDSQPIKISQEFIFGSKELEKYVYGGTGRSVLFSYQCN